MKYLFAIFLLSSLLFSAQRQVILGCYSVKSNAENALVKLNEQIKSNADLKEVMDTQSLRVINTGISGYTVVSVNYFDSYTDTYTAMKVLKPYYNDVYSLKYPTRGISDKEYLKDVKKKAEEEARAIEEAAQMDMLAAQKLQNDLASQKASEEEKMQVLEAAKDMPVVNTLEDNLSKEEVNKVVVPIKAQVIPSQSIFEEELVQDEGVNMSGYYLLIGLIFLLLILGAIIIRRKFLSSDTKE